MSNKEYEQYISDMVLDYRTKREASGRVYELRQFARDTLAEIREDLATEKDAMVAKMLTALNWNPRDKIIEELSKSGSIDKLVKSDDTYSLSIDVHLPLPEEAKDIAAKYKAITKHYKSLLDGFVENSPENIELQKVQSESSYPEINVNTCVIRSYESEFLGVIARVIKEGFDVHYIHITSGVKKKIVSTESHYAGMGETDHMLITEDKYGNQEKIHALRLDFFDENDVQTYKIEVN
ncbi:hypothetical protein [Vibrio crassostreae]|uniref:hypothetical protein n=1 Tax=Vibrio crassostreae TaxID=246167 RepID=UPI001B306C80|nr:hypothetical protein [Vibrio crassostreae]